MMRATAPCPMKMPWQRPSARIGLYLPSARMMRLSGFEKLMNSAFGQSSCISRTKSNTSGKVRNVKNSPPGPPFSPSVCRMPYLRGTPKSSFQSRLRSIAVALTTNPAPSKAARRSVVCSMIKPAPVLVFNSLANSAIFASVFGLRPTSVSVEPRNSPAEKMSATCSGQTTYCSRRGRRFWYDWPLSRSFCTPRGGRGSRVTIFSFGIDRGHRLREFLVYVIANRHRSEIGVFAVEAALGWLVRVLEPVIADERRLSHSGSHVMPEASGALGLSRDQRPGAIGVGQARIRTAEGEFADQTGLPGSRIGVDHFARIKVIAIERNDVGMTRCSIGHAGRRNIGEPAAEQEMAGIGSFDRRTCQREIALRYQRRECVAIGCECPAPGIGTIGAVLVASATLIRRLSPVRRLGARQQGECVPGCGGRAPRRVELLKIGIALAQPVESGDAARTAERQENKNRQRFIVAAPIRPPAQFVVDEPADDGLIITSRSAQHLRPAADVAIEIGIEHVWKILSWSSSRRIVLGAGERHAEIKIRRQGELHAARFRHRLVRPGTKRVIPPAGKSPRDSGAPCVLVPIFPLARLGVRNVIAVLNPILIEPHRIDPLGKKAAPVGIDEPENSVAFSDPEVSARRKIAVGNTAPSGSRNLG